MLRLALVVLLTGALLAGCASSPDAATTDPAAPGITVDPNRPPTDFVSVKTGPASGPDLNATTAAAPRLVEGEWWRIQFDSGFYDAANEVVRVVANATEEGYIFGMPHEGWFKEAIAYHAPAFGDVNLDLSYATHNVVFEPVRFPLVQGATWETFFAASPLTATVEQADDYTAVIRFDPPETDPQPTDAVMAALLGGGGSGSIRMTYDARQHEIVEMESFIGTWKVIEHGYDFRGWVTVPRGEHTAIDYGTFWALEGTQPITTRNVEVEGGFNRLTMMHVIVPIKHGNFHIRSIAPDGTEFLTESLASDQFMVRFYEATDPDGTWAQEDSVIGVAATYSMGIAYHQYDIHVPDGARRTDHSHDVIR